MRNIVTHAYFESSFYSYEKHLYIRPSLQSYTKLIYCRLSDKWQKGLTTSYINIQIDPFASKLTICITLSQVVQESHEESVLN